MLVNERASGGSCGCTTVSVNAYFWKCEIFVCCTHAGKRSWGITTAAQLQVSIPLAHQSQDAPPTPMTTAHPKKNKGRRGPDQKKKKRKNPNRERARHKQHPDNNQFDDSFRYTEFRESDSFQKVFFALAMNWNHARDVLRLRALSLLRPGFRVVSVDRNVHKGIYGKRHVEANFRTPEGRKDIVARMATELRVSPKAQITVVLDYFFFQGGYYSSNYGVDWLSDACHQLIIGGATDVILPYDSGKTNQAKCEMLAMFSGRASRDDPNYPGIAEPHPGIQFKFIGAEDNPLWVASESPEIAAAMLVLKNLSTDNYSQTVKFLHPKTPFVVVTAASI